MPTHRSRIEQWSINYHMLKFYVDRCTRTFFRTTIVNKDKVPFDEVLIFGMNHQNALIDALAVLATRTWQPVFLARADIFKKPTIAKILTFLKILPVYRIRDGYSTLQMNDEIFLKTLDVLRNRNCLILMPEGNHGDKRNLRQLKKGIARIAFQAEEASGNTLKIKIIPIGLEYSNYIKFRSKLLIRFGEPIEVSKYLNLYKENQALAYNTLLDEFTEKIMPQMIHIEDDENYQNIEMLRRIFSPTYIKMAKLPGDHNTLFEVDKKLIAFTDNIKTRQPELFRLLMEKVSGYSGLLNKFHLNPEQYPFKVNPAILTLKILALAITLPLFIYGLINNIIPVYLPYRLSKKFKDEQFHSSIKLAAGLILFPISYLVQTLLFWAVSGNGILTLLYFISLPVSAIILYNWRRYWQSITANFEIIKARSAINGIRQEHETISEIIQIR